MVRLAEVADTALGKMLDAARPKGSIRVPYLRNINVQWGRIDTNNLSEVDLSPEERARFQLCPGDLLVCEGGEIGRAAVWQGGTRYVAYQKALHRVRSRGELNLAYLRYLLEHYAGTGRLADMATGSTIVHLPQRQLRSLPVPLAPLDEQRRIVEILEDHLSRLDAARTELIRACARIPTVVESWLSAHTIIRAAPRKALKDLIAEPLANGRSVPDGDGFPVLRLTCLVSGRVDPSKRKNGAWSDAEGRSFVVRRGDFLVARGNGTLRLVGRGALVDEQPSEDVAFPDTLIRVRPHADALVPEFLSLVWNTGPIRAQIEAKARTTAGIYKINQSHLRDVLLPVPNLVDQRAIAIAAADVNGSVERLRTDVQSASRQSKMLQRVLLEAAFGGGLTRGARGNDLEQELAGV